MIVGRTLVPMYDSQITCAYSGCSSKTMSVDASIAGMRFPLSFGGLTEPYFEDAHRTSDNGADLHPDTILRVRWKRLQFFSEHPVLGRIEIKMISEKSTGRVQSLARAKPLLSGWIQDAFPPNQGHSFFPAINENRLYFRISLPRFGLEFENDEPVVNGAVIEQIPPLSTAYRLQKPVQFRSASRLNPFTMTLENCRMAMAVLRDIKLTVESLTKTGENTSRLVVVATNESTEDHVRMAVRPYSPSNIEVETSKWFLDVGRKDSRITFDIDISKALPASCLYLAFMIIQPFDNLSSNTLTIDYEELRRGQQIEGYPQVSTSAVLTADMTV